jgi:hypothetical protein
VICPLLAAGDNANPNLDMRIRTDCRKEECAWWHETETDCAILLIAKRLRKG